MRRRSMVRRFDRIQVGEDRGEVRPRARRARSRQSGSQRPAAGVSFPRMGGFPPTGLATSTIPSSRCCPRALRNMSSRPAGNRASSRLARQRPSLRQRYPSFRRRLLMRSSTRRHTPRRHQAGPTATLHPNWSGRRACAGSGFRSRRPRLSCLRRRVPLANTHGLASDTRSGADDRGHDDGNHTSPLTRPTPPEPTTTPPDPVSAVSPQRPAQGQARSAADGGSKPAVTRDTTLKVLPRSNTPPPSSSPPPSSATSPTTSPVPASAPSRFRSDLWSLPNEPLLGFVEIPEGQFTMGSDERLRYTASSNELPQHKVVLPRYFIGRYEVTVAQFRAFVQAGGYPADTKISLDGQSDLPVVGVWWHDAVAYATWLDKTLRESVPAPASVRSLLSTPGCRVTLPSEAEWEKAARGTDARVYPWGGSVDLTKANYLDSGSGAERRLPNASWLISRWGEPLRPPGHERQCRGMDPQSLGCRFETGLRVSLQSKRLEA